MATATIQQAAAALGHDVFGGNRTPPKTIESAQDAKQLVADYSANTAKPLPPSQITTDPASKELGASSRELSADDFDLLRTLGTGTFARVWLVRLANRGKEDENKVFALKVLRKADIIRLKQVEHVRNERAALASVAGHPFITTMITSFADHERLFMLLDYCPGGEVFSYLRKAKRFDTATARFYAAEIVLILEFLHENLGVAYRDLKPENLLIDADGHIKLVDFGFAKTVGDRETYTLCGTPEYLAPEVIQSKGHGTAVDWWAFGILLYEFIVGQPPFWDENPIKIYEKIVNEPVRFPRGMPSDAQDLITALCTVNRSKRLGNISGGASRVKSHHFFKGIDWEALYNRQGKGPIIPCIKHAADTSNFDEYPAESDQHEPYTSELFEHYEEAFKDF
ncbi:MAG: v-type proton ATPase 16 kDa proteolipid subunit 2 [Chaenotheca gracillima]|nr:MAG: v-type proton ATPase 16 kDa proteolipid subunit 2 [Chaenotheca gracillima]